MANEQRLIDANAFERHVMTYTSPHEICDDCLQNFTDELQTFPTVDAVEVVHGHWIEHSHLEVGGECSVCGWQFQWFENDEAHYCPHCGAKMDGGAGRDITESE